MVKISMSSRIHNYTAYSVGCAAVWGGILLVARRVADVQTRKTLQMGCAAWWSGWTSATIARFAYPPPRKLGPRGEEALRIGSVPLVALGLVSAIRFIWAGRRHRT